MDGQHKCNSKTGTHLLTAQAKMEVSWRGRYSIIHSMTLVTTRGILTHKWVKAHQDTNIPYSELPWPTKLNVMVGSLACYSLLPTCMKSLSKRPQPNPAFSPHQNAPWLLVNGQWITAGFPDAIPFHILGTQHWLYLQRSKLGASHSDNSPAYWAKTSREMTINAPSFTPQALPVQHNLSQSKNLSTCSQMQPGRNEKWYGVF